VRAKNSCGWEIALTFVRLGSFLFWIAVVVFLVGQAFDPEAIENMSAALVAACDALHLKVCDDPATRFVAEKVIEFAQRGIRDPNTLRRLTLKEFGLSDDIIFPQPATNGAVLR
jgi:hypothetical protein